MSLGVSNQKNTDTIEARINQLGITAHCYSPDRKQIAVAVKDVNLIEIYEVGKDVANPGSWKLLHTLKDQTQNISTLSWSVKNAILSGSFDRSVIVWQFDKQKKNEWKQELVILVNNNRGIVDGNWSKDGKKFCIGTGSKKVYLGYWEEAMNWWNAKMIPNFKSSVLAVDYHPSGRVVATGSSDYTFKIISSFIQECDAGDNYKGPFDNVQDHGTVLFSINNTGGWVNAIAWSPSGNNYGYAVHTSQVFFGKVNGSNIEEKEQNVNCQGLPFKKLLFKKEDELIGGGFDGKPTIFKNDGKQWQESVTIQENELSKMNLVRKKSKVSGAISMFEKNKAGTNQKAQKATEVTDHHKNPIESLQVFSDNAGNVNQVSTSDVNGKLLIWNV